MPARINIPGLLAAPLLVLCALALAQGSDAMTSNFTSFVATVSMPLQLGYYASAKKDCTPAALPILKVIEPPTQGTLTVRRGILTTDTIPGCAGLKTPTQVVFYVARVGSGGRDHLVYQVTNSDGRSGVYDVSIEIKEATAAPDQSQGPDKI
jgi:hypothetical protein